MTDKQIIIDGVDVSGCELFLEIHEDTSTYEMDGWEYAENWCKCFYEDCKNHPNCYYKQLKRKEQECEELKRQHQGDKGLITSTGKMNYQLLQEYDKLKTALTEIKEIAKNGCYDDCGMPLDELSIILQKISEVENGKI